MNRAGRPLFMKTYGKQNRKLEAWISPDNRKQVFASTSSSDLSIAEPSSPKPPAKRGRKRSTADGSRALRPAKTKALSWTADISSELRLAKTKALSCLREQDSDEENIFIVPPPPLPPPQQQSNNTARKPLLRHAGRKAQRIVSSSESDGETTTSRQPNSKRSKHTTARARTHPSPVLALGKFVTHRRGATTAKHKAPKRKLSVLLAQLSLNSSDDFVQGGREEGGGVQRSFPRRAKQGRRRALANADSSLADLGNSGVTNSNGFLRDISLNESPERSCHRKPLFSSTPSSRALPPPPSFLRPPISLSTTQEELNVPEDPLSLTELRQLSSLGQAVGQPEVGTREEPTPRGSTSLRSNRSRNGGSAIQDGVGEQPSPELFSAVACEQTDPDRAGEETEDGSHFVSAMVGQDWLAEVVKERCLTRCCAVRLERHKLHDDTTCSPCIDQTRSHDNGRDSLVPKEHVPRDSLVPKEHVPRDSLVPKEHVPRDSLVPKEHVPRDSLVPKEHVPRDSLVPKEHVPRDSLVPIDHVPRDSLVPIEHVPRDSLGPIEQVPKDSLVPKDHVPMDSLVPKDHVPMDSLVPIEHVPKDSLGPIDHVPRDSLVPKDHVPRDSLVPKDHVPRENPHRRKVGGAPKERRRRSVSRERPATSRKVGGAPKERRSVSRERPATSRKMCVSGVSVSRWGRRDGAPNSRAAPPPGRAGDCSITELLSAQHTHGVSSLSDRMVLGTPVRGTRLHLSSLLVNLTPETHTWSRLKAALSLHRKTKAFLTPKRPLYLLSSPEAELGVGLEAELEAELGDVSQKLFSTPRNTPRPPNLRSTIRGSAPLSVYSLDGELSDDQKVFSECNQTGPLGFQDCLPAARMKLCRKIGEGTFGEVFSTTNTSGDAVALKIIPVEGCDQVNGEEQKTFGEILHEIIISKELSSLKEKKHNQTTGFIGLKDLHCVKGCYPPSLLKAWDSFNTQRGSENDRPDFFNDEQLFLILEFEFGGKDLENSNGQLASVMVSKSILHQVTAALAVAEQELCFEHRDLHWGNVLVQSTKEKEGSFLLNGTNHSLETRGVSVRIIDYSLSRLEIDGLTVSCDISEDEELFQGHGDLQFDIYRLMRQENGNKWGDYQPHSNVLWLHYLSAKLLTMTYKSRGGRGVKQARLDLQGFHDDVLTFRSASDILYNCGLFQ
ncbi:uncharacterized protein LOC109886932 isoform X2 [Oncorhynchus kisutch]|uniref:uncharacterized protein LOC109886932 isoform X2 n=1 Tax=Oncorhynchus kisutch TaxID=8019 RepID=UPI0012DD10E4|nr:uncharacterized protein LOC109886932 isoform X2 [Oncorhynchus kisutch]